MREVSVAGVGVGAAHGDGFAVLVDGGGGEEGVLAAVAVWKAGVVGVADADGVRDGVGVARSGVPRGVAVLEAAAAF